MKHTFISLLILGLFIILLFFVLPGPKIDTLPTQDEVKSLTFKDDGEDVQTTDAKIIADILNTMENATKTLRSSNHDQPLTKNFYTLVFKGKNDQTDTFYFYQSGHRYYIEKPYEGIYRTTADVTSIFDNFQ